jgi:hypothetical protein
MELSDSICSDDRCVPILMFLFAEWDKTDAQKKREKMLLDELVSIVNKRDELVQHLDSQEKAYVISIFLLFYCICPFITHSSEYSS